MAIKASEDDQGVAPEPGTLGGIAMPESTADSTFGLYVQAWAKRIRYGESGVLPVLLGLIVLVIIFQVQDSVFLSAGNLTNLIVQGSVFVLLGMAEVWVLILGEIDLSIGFVAGIGGVVTAILAAPPYNYTWWVAIIIGMLCTAGIGVLQGTLVIRLRLPSFVVTLAGLLGWEGVLLYLVNADGTGGTIRISDPVLIDLANGNLSPLAGWIIAIVSIALFAAVTILRDVRRRKGGLVAPPLSITILKVAVVAAAVIGLVLICNTNRGALVPLAASPTSSSSSAASSLSTPSCWGGPGSVATCTPLAATPKPRAAAGSVSGGTNSGPSPSPASPPVPPASSTPRDSVRSPTTSTGATWSSMPWPQPSLVAPASSVGAAR